MRLKTEVKDVEQVNRERGKILPPLLDYLTGDIRLQKKTFQSSWTVLKIYGRRSGPKQEMIFFQNLGPRSESGHKEKRLKLRENTK